MDGEQLVEVGALSQRLVCVEAASHWLLESACDSVQMKRGPAHDHDSALATPPPTKRRAVESDSQEIVAMEGVSTSTAVSHTVATEPVSTDTASNQSPANQEAVREVDGNSEQRVTDVEGAELNKDPAPSQIKGVCLGSEEFDFGLLSCVCVLMFTFVVSDGAEGAADQEEQ